MGPPAIDLWGDTKAAAETLLTGQSVTGYLFEVVVGNSVLSALVTGFEGYCEQRFVELESEGIPGNFARLVSTFLSKEARAVCARGRTRATTQSADCGHLRSTTGRPTDQFSRLQCQQPCI